MSLFASEQLRQGGTRHVVSCSQVSCFHVSHCRKVRSSVTAFFFHRIPLVGLFCYGTPLGWIVLFLDTAISNLVPFSLHKLNVDSFIHTSIQCYLPVPITPDLHPVFPTYPVPVYGHRTCGRRLQEPTGLEKPHAHQGGGGGGHRERYGTETKESRAGSPQATCSATSLMVHTKGWGEIWHQGSMVG